jgi:hypothetical protein
MAGIGAKRLAKQKASLDTSLRFIRDSIVEESEKLLETIGGESNG